MKRATVRFVLYHLRMVVQRSLPAAVQGVGRLLQDLWRGTRAWAADVPLTAVGPAVADVVCCLCGHSKARQLFPREVPNARGYTVVQCGRCALVFLDPPPLAADIPGFYSETYYGADNAKFGPLTEKFVFLFRLARIRALRLMGIHKGRVLDVGCGRGLFLKMLRRRGFDVYGTELDATSAQSAKRLVGDDRICVLPIADAGFPAGHFDAVTAWQVFEHLPDPGGALDAYHRLLRPGGALLLTVPNIASWQARWAGADWFHLDVPRHIYHYSPVTLTALLERHDFRVEAVSHYSLEQNPFGLIQSALHRLGAPHMGLYNLLRGPLDRRQRSRLRRLPAYAAYLAAFPAAAAISYCWSFLGSGATFVILARRIDA